MIFFFPFFPVPGHFFIPLVFFDIRINHGHEEPAGAQCNQAVQAVQNQSHHSFHNRASLCQEIIIVSCSKIIFCTGLATEGFAITDFLQIVQSASNAFIAVAVKGIEVDGRTAIDAGVDFRAFQDMLAVGIDDARLGSRIGIDEEAVLIGIIARAFQVAVTERRLDGFESRYSAAITFEFALTFIIGSLDSSSDAFDRFRIGLRNDERYTILRRTTIDRLRVPNICIRPAGIDSCDYLTRISKFFCYDKFLLIFNIEIVCRGVHGRAFIRFRHQDWLALRLFN